MITMNKKSSYFWCRKAKTRYEYCINFRCGNPLISDPGFHLVRQCRGGRYESGATTRCLLRQLRHYVHRASHLDRFALKVFTCETKARKDKLENVAEEDRTLIFCESTHRIFRYPADMQDVLRGDRYCACP